jgi:transposase
MTKYREILRLKSLNFSERNIALSCSCSRNTVSKVVKRASELNISWPVEDRMADSVLEKTLFPQTKANTVKRTPDFSYIRKELLKNGVSKKLLWAEYMEDCRLTNEEPLMYSLFCNYIQQGLYGSSVRFSLILL